MESKTCPRCGKAGSVKELFGYRKRNAGLRPQSYCLECRSGKKVKPAPERVIVAPATSDADEWIKAAPCTKCGTKDHMRRYLAKQKRYHSWCKECERKARNG